MSKENEAAIEEWTGLIWDCKNRPDSENPPIVKIDTEALKSEKDQYVDIKYNG